MNRTRRGGLAGLVLVVAAVSAAPARAELYKDVARGLALLDFRFSGQRNLLGDGVTVNTAAVYNDRQFDFGVAELRLTGVLSASVGFTRRGIPGADFSLNTAGTPLAYTLDTKIGLQDLKATGSVLIDVDTDLNLLGFYDQRIQISNRGDFETAGLAGVDAGTLAFDIGPVSMSGNIFADALAVLTDPFFQANGVDNPFAQFSQQSARLIEATKSVAELQARAASGEILTDAEVATLVNQSILAAVLGGQPPEGLFDGLTLSPGLLESADDSALPAGVHASPVPEPASLSLLVLAVATGASLRRRRR